MRLPVLLFFCLCVALTQNSFAEAAPMKDAYDNPVDTVDGRKVRRYEFQSSREAFVDGFGSVSDITGWADEEKVRNNPVSPILSFYWCWFEGDSSPFCKIEFLDSNETAILTSTVAIDHGVLNQTDVEQTCKGAGATNCSSSKIQKGRTLDEWLPLKASELKLDLGENLDQVKSVHMYQDTETDKAWGVFLGLFGAEIVTAAAMLVELPVSYLMDTDYDWKVVGLAALGGFVGFTVYGVITINPSPSRCDVIIKF